MNAPDFATLRLPAALSLAAIFSAVTALVGCEESEVPAASTGTSAVASSSAASAAGSASPGASANPTGGTETDSGSESGTASQVGTEAQTGTSTQTGTASLTGTATQTGGATATDVSGTQTGIVPSSSSTPTASAVASAPPPPPPASLPAPKPGSADAIALEVDNIYVPQRTFKARFKQSHRLKVQGVTKESTGTIFVEKPNKLSFRYDPPNQNRIVSDGKEIKTYIPADEQMFVQSVQNTEYPGALSFIMGNGIRPSFTFEFNAKKWAPGHTLVGTPRVPTPHYEQVYFFVDKVFLGQKSAETMKTVIILDVQGNRNRFDFTDASHPASIPPAEFTFQAPPGTTIVRK